MLSFASRTLTQLPPAGRLLNQRNAQVLASQVYLADSFWSRLRGLLGEGAMPAGTSLLIPDCKSIHTFGMAFSIDALFVDSSARVVAIYHSLPPMRMTRIWLKAKDVIELPAGQLAGLDVKTGDQLNVGH